SKLPLVGVTVSQSGNIIKFASGIDQLSVPSPVFVMVKTFGLGLLPNSKAVKDITFGSTTRFGAEA
ncbi:MAG: hypothetical protein ACYSOW_01380, partial [Planctomycetota bacterium]